MNTVNVLIEQFVTERMETVKERWEIAEKMRTKFVSDFPIDEILELSLSDYLLSPQGTANDDSFCRRLRYELDATAHMGNVFPSVFGIYLKDGTVVKLSSTLQNKFGSDIDGAFSDFKQQIVDLLHNAHENNYDAIAESKINSSFKYKLLITYFSHKFIPVCTKGTLEAYCNVVGLNLPANTDMIYRNTALLDWKNTYYPFVEWDNFIFMCFCDWAWRNEKSLKDLPFQKANHVVAERIDQEIESLQFTGVERETLVKIRVNQSVFRNKLLHKYGKCCLCAVQKPELLIASHIKPWSECLPEEKLDVNNGFLLCPNHDRLFDGGWISFNDNGKILISKQLSASEMFDLNVDCTMHVLLNDQNRGYLQYHRNNIFKGDN